MKQPRKKKPLVRDIKALLIFYKQNNQNKNKMENKNNTAVLFKNESKTENAPNYKGKIILNDKEHYLSAWVKKAKSGISYMSLSVGELVEAKKQTAAPVKAENDDDLPF